MEVHTKNIRQKLVIGALAVGLVISLCIGGTLAFLTDSAEVTNVFSVGDLDIALTEPNWKDAQGANLRPGSTTTKDPVVEAVKNDSYMRVYVYYVDGAYDPTAEPAQDYKDFLIDNNTTAGAERLALIKQTIYYDETFVAETPAGAIDLDTMYSLDDLKGLASVTNGVNSAFTRDATRSAANGSYDVYNYTGGTGVFAEGTKVILFSNIVVPTDWNQSQMAKLSSYKVIIRAEAIQTDGFADAAAAFTALDDEVRNGTIQQK